MPRLNKKTLSVVLLGVVAAWLTIQYLLPLLMPFLLGAALALAAEPMVKRLSEKLPRPAATAIGVTGALCLLLCVVALLAAVLVREVGFLVNALPDMGEAAQQGLHSLEGFLLTLAEKTPDNVRPVLSRSVTGLFSDGNAIVEQLLQRLPSIASSFLGWVPGSALAVGTGILSAFMVSARFAKIKHWLSRLKSTSAIAQYLPIAHQVRKALGGWLKAQLTLLCLCFLIVGTGLLILKVPYGPFWAFLIALVDAIPILGTGTVLLPWSLISLLQGQQVKAIGLLSIYVVAVLSRSIFEPRLVGKQLGLDPLVTLIALYAGFQFWGIGGILLAPMICVVLTELIRAKV